MHVPGMIGCSPNAIQMYINELLNKDTFVVRTVVFGPKGV